MIVDVELSGEWPELARAELTAVAGTLGVRGAPVAVALSTMRVDLANGEAAREMIERLSLARRASARLGLLDECAPAPRAPGEGGCVRRRGHPTGGARDPAIDLWAGRWIAAGGTIDLTAPARRFWIVSDPSSEGNELFEEIGASERTALVGRRISLLPFRRPVGLDPRLARAAANLAGAGPGRTVVDPFVGTGALLAEAALLGARVWGIDRDPEMVRGAARNLEFLGRPAERLIGGDSAAVAAEVGAATFDALLTDAPYGRASPTGGEPVAALLERVLPPWAARVRPGGRVVLVTAGGPDPLPSPWRRTVSVAVRQHRSLTREFRVYERAGAGPAATL